MPLRRYVLVLPLALGLVLTGPYPVAHAAVSARSVKRPERLDPAAAAQVAADRALAALTYRQARLWLAALPPASVPTTTVPKPVIVLPPARPQGSPTPISTRRCSGAIEALIESTFGPAGPWASSIAVRESHCTPGIVNSEGCLGLFQFCGHDDIFSAICGPQTTWVEAGCEVRAAFVLYEGSGIGPWSP